jgi:acetolactate synthase-1/2/3 large subunit
MTFRVADYIAARLSFAGIKEVFLVTGGGAMHLNDAFARNKNLNIVCFHHEQAAAIAAEGYSRVSSSSCALNVTTGPGAVNALTGVYGAYVDSIPMFVVSGQVKRETIATNFPEISLRQLGDQEVDICNMVRPIVKYVTLVQSATEIERALDTALYLMTSGRPGPVWLDVPIDVQAAPAPHWNFERMEFFRGGGFNNQPSIKDPGVTPNTLLELSARKIPGDIQKEFIDSVDIPVVPGWNALDLIPNDHKNYVGRAGTVGDRSGNFAVQRADLVLVIACRLNIRQISYNSKSFAKNAYKIMVDVDQAELSKPTLTIDRKVLATAEQIIEYLHANWHRIGHHEQHLKFRDWCKANLRRYPVVDDKKRNSSKLNPYVFLEFLSKACPPNSVVVAGNGSACVIGFQVFDVKDGQRIFTNSGCASMGYDLPAAIGASIAKTNGEQPVICLAGDGSIMMNLQELQTLSSLNLNVKIFIINNNGYLSIRQTQSAYFPDNIFGTSPDDGLKLPDFESIARAFKISYSRVNSLSSGEISAVQNAIGSFGPQIVEVCVDPDQGFEPKLSSRKNPDGTMTSPELEDMAPFLPREELEEVMVREVI